MSTFSSEQSAIFNQVRYKSKKRKDIALDISHQQADVGQRQARVQGVASRTVRLQGGLLQKQKGVAIKQKKIARDVADLSREQEEVAKKQEIVAREEADLSHEQEEIAKEQAEIAQEQNELTQEQAEIIQVQAEIAKGQEEILREQAEIVKVNNTITELSAMDAGLQTDVVDTLNQLDEEGALKPVLFDFDDACKTIFWENNGSVCLTKLQYNIVKILYHAPACQMSITDLEERAWGKDTLPTTEAAKMAVSRLNQELKKANFPFEVIRIQRELKTDQVEHPITKMAMDVTVQPEIEVYELVRW